MAPCSAVSSKLEVFTSGEKFAYHLDCNATGSLLMVKEMWKWHELKNTIHWLMMDRMRRHTLEREASETLWHIFATFILDLPMQEATACLTWKSSSLLLGPQ